MTCRMLFLNTSFNQKKIKDFWFQNAKAFGYPVRYIGIAMAHCQNPLVSCLL